MTIAIIFSTYILPGITLSGFWTALLVALVLGLLNAFIKPLILILTLPINILTLGLFTLVINAAIILMVSAIVPGFNVDGFWYALLFSIVLSIILYLIHSIG
jgi:putative membrane protein